MTRAFPSPSPNTVCVPSFHRSHALHPAAATRKTGSVGLAGISGAAVCTRLLAILNLMHPHRPGRLGSYKLLDGKDYQADKHEISYGISHLQYQEASRVCSHHAAGGKDRPR